MRRSIALFTLLTACAAAPIPAAEENEEAYEHPHPVVEAVEHPARSAEDRERDEARQPIAVLRFFDVDRGDVVVDLMATRGWYTEILARAVGPTGKVYVQNNRYVLDKFAEEPLSKRLAALNQDNVVRWDRELDDLQLRNESADHVLMVLFYHDTYWMDVDRKKLNAQVFAALKPGGIYGIVDHHAAAGSKHRDVKSLHRVDAELVKQEILDAGFEFVGSSDELAHPEDDRTLNVFDEKIRGKTDRFVFAFRKAR